MRQETTEGQQGVYVGRPEINAATKVGNERERLQHGRMDGAEMYVEWGRGECGR